MEGTFLRDLQVLLVLLVVLVQLALRAFLDRLALKVSQVRQGLQALKESLAQRVLLDPLAFLEYRLYPFHRSRLSRLFQEKKETMARASRDIQEVRVLLGLLAQQAILDQQDLAVSTVWLEQLERELQGPWATQDQQELAENLVLPDLLEKGLSALLALPGLQVQRELKALLVRPGLRERLQAAMPSQAL